jgi:hypothetical protein
MRLLFWRRYEDYENEDEWEVVEAPKALAPPPDFALAVSGLARDGWHMAALVREAGNIDFYVRAVTVRWPFVIARPMRSNRASPTPVRPDQLSPASTSPASKLVVNWPWERIDDEAAKLRFYVKRLGPVWFSRTRTLNVRLTLKEVPPPRRRMVVQVSSNRVDWKKAAMAPATANPLFAAEAPAVPASEPAPEATAAAEPSSATPAVAASCAEVRPSAAQAETP